MFVVRVAYENVIDFVVFVGAVEAKKKSDSELREVIDILLWLR